MKDALWIAAILLVPLFGLVTWRIPLVRTLGAGARLAIAFAAGCVVLSATMFVLSVVHLEWTRTVMIILAIVAIGVYGALRQRGGTEQRPRSLGTAAALIAVFLLLTLYGVLTARETCADLLYFWGPKAQRFGMMGRIDTTFLAAPHYQLMHPDYPPLVPLVYAFASIAAHGLSWWGALVLTPLLLLATALVFHGLAREPLGDERSMAYAMLLTAILAYGYARSMVAGAGEPMLLLFETIAVAALTFRDDSPDGAILASIALAGAIWTKVEGAAFAGIVLVAYLVTRRQFRRAIASVVPAAVLLAAWLAFARHFGFIDQYGRARQQVHLEALPLIARTTARVASYQAFYLPWVAAVLPLSFGRRWGRAALPLLVACGLISSTIYFYLHGFSPTWWIMSSAERVLLSPLMCLLVASAAASE